MCVTHTHATHEHTHTHTHKHTNTHTYTPLWLFNNTHGAFIGHQCFAETKFVN